MWFCSRNTFIWNMIWPALHGNLHKEDSYPKQGHVQWENLAQGPARGRHLANVIFALQNICNTFVLKQEDSLGGKQLLDAMHLSIHQARGQAPDRHRKHKEELEECEVYRRTSYKMMGWKHNQRFICERHLLTSTPLPSWLGSAVRFILDGENFTDNLVPKPQAWRDHVAHSRPCGGPTHCLVGSPNAH